jgi:hypothetical protein
MEQGTFGTLTGKLEITYTILAAADLVMSKIPIRDASTRMRDAVPFMLLVP